MRARMDCRSWTTAVVGESLRFVVLMFWLWEPELVRPKRERPGEAQPIPGGERRQMGNVTQNLLKSGCEYGLSKRAYGREDESMA